MQFFFFFYLCRILAVARCSAQASLLFSMWDLSSLTRDQTQVPCFGSQILNHCTTREVPPLLFYIEEGSSNMNGPRDGHTK